MSDPASHNDTRRIQYMMTKEYAHDIYSNITDVCYPLTRYFSGHLIKFN